MKFQGSFLSKGKRICWKDLEIQEPYHLALCREPYIQIYDKRYKNNRVQDNEE